MTYLSFTSLSPWYKRLTRSGLAISACFCHLFPIIIHGVNMVSPTAQTRVIRANKDKKFGRKRKNKLANHGSTRSQTEMFGSKEPEGDKKK
jgi:hypothetical protein